MMQDGADAYDALVRFLYQAPIGLLQTTLDGEITMINPMSAALLMPFARDGDLANLFDILEPVAPALRAAALGSSSPGRVICDGLRITMPSAVPRAAGRLQTLSLRIQQLDRATLVASLADVTVSVGLEEERLAMRLHDASRVDALTSLPNRVVVMESIAAALVEAQAAPRAGFAVMCVNCDRFESVNVTLGAAIGDELLRLVGARLCTVVRSHDGADVARSRDQVAARLGGDDFVVVFHKLRTHADAHRIALRLVDVLAQPYVIGEHRVHVTASIGVFLDAGDADEPAAVLQCATIAMNEAKRAGGARYSVFERDMKDRVARRGALEHELRQAIAGGELFVVYQPITAFASGHCVGVEALVRWRHPVRGIVAPIDFIGVAEETGLIGDLGNFVLTASCRQLAEWRSVLGSTTAPRSISVNLSRAQLLDGAIVRQVLEALHGCGLPPECLQLEVTESLAAQDATVREQLGALKALGVTLALDDFGTGYSSLSSLHQLPVDVVKIDRSFVSQLESSAHHRVLVEATVKVAQSLGMSTVAEGIETPGQWHELARLQCDKAQGYLISRPIAAEEATRWLIAHAARHGSAPDPARGDLSIGCAA